MNKKKEREKRIYKKGLMNGVERDAFNKEKAGELFNKQKLSNKKLAKNSH